MKKLPITPTKLIESDLFPNIKLFIKRDDLIHPFISGNKWRKLKYNILQMSDEEKDTLLTFGGAFSNHIYATAAAGREFDFKTIGIIRGERILPLNPTLSFAEKAGMKLQFVNRTTYKKRYEDAFLSDIARKYNFPYILPEGGTNQYALPGCAELINEIAIDFDYICTASGTGGTLAGMISASKPSHQLLGFSALKGGDFLIEEVNQLLKHIDKKEIGNWQIIKDYHFGGYAKHQPELISFINDFKHNHQIALDPIYTGKMLFGISDLAKKGFFEKNSTVIALHTGGLQGIEGFNQRFGNILT